MDPTAPKIPPGAVSPEQTQVEGDIKIRVIILIIVGAVLILLALGGIVILALKPEVFGSYWSTVLPIISGALFGLIGFVVGRKESP
jgi:hypothetical protein